MTTTESNALIRSTWQDVQRQSDCFSVTFYDTLFSLDPALRPMFQADLGLQRRRLVDMISAAVGLLDDPATLTPALRDLGARHGRYGVRDAHYATVGAALLVALGATLGPGFTPPARWAWVDVFGTISSVMMDAARPVAAPAKPKPRVSAAAAMLLVLASGGVMAADPAPFGTHPALLPRGTTAVAAPRNVVDPNTFILGHPASPTTRGGHANFDHPAIQVARLAKTRTVDPNTFIVQPPASVTWRVEPEAEDGHRMAQAGGSGPVGVR